MRNGVVYVAWGKQYVIETIRSVESHEFPSVLITDQDFANDRFDQIIKTDFSSYSNLCPYYRKLESIRQTPYEVTLFADSDLLITSDISFGFIQAAKFGFAAAIAPGQMFRWLEQDYIHFNGGLLFFRGQPHDWADCVLSHAQTFTTNDEPAWSLAFHELGINPVALPEVYNHIPFAKLHPRKIRVWHSRSVQSYTHL